MSKRRRFTPDFKAQVVLEDLSSAKSTAEKILLPLDLFRVSRAPP